MMLKKLPGDAPCLSRLLHHQQPFFCLALVIRDRVVVELVQSLRERTKTQKYISWDQGLAILIKGLN